MIHPRILSTAQKLDRKFSLLMWNSFDLVGQFLWRYNLEKKKIIRTRMGFVSGTEVELSNDHPIKSYRLIHKNTRAILPLLKKIYTH